MFWESIQIIFQLSEICFIGEGCETTRMEIRRVKKEIAKYM